MCRDILSILILYALLIALGLGLYHLLDWVL